MANELAVINNFQNMKPVGTSANTGLTLYQSVQLKPNGFVYGVGVRDSHGLLIVEGIAEGTACTFLCGVQVRDKETGEEICTIPVAQGTHYSRQLVMELVHLHLCQAVEESAARDGRAVDQDLIEAQVVEWLDDCYFAESRKAALCWAERVGIIEKKEVVA